MEVWRATEHYAAPAHATRYHIWSVFLIGVPAVLSGLAARLRSAR